MKTMTIEARDKDGVLLGSREVEKPETWEEHEETFDHEQTMKGTWKSFVIEVQAELRNEVRKPSKENDNVKAFKKMTPAEQAALLAKLSA